MIAMALITKPDLLIADEPTTALDVTVQAQILDLIRKKCRRSWAWLSCSSATILVWWPALCDRVMVMYAGRVMESARTGDLFRDPKHPYTRALQKSIPALQVKGRELYTIAGAPPDLLHALPGCPFAPRCDHLVDYCSREEIQPLEVAPAHASACLRVQKEKLQL
jgi:oligopeptide transport system ATP-binding protein